MKTRAQVLLKDIKANTKIYTEQIQSTIKNIKEIYEEDLLNKTEELLVKISNDYSIDLNELKRKYMKNKKKSLTNNDDESGGNEEPEPDAINTNVNNINNFPKLIKCELDNGVYYVEMINNGKVFDINYNEVGKWSNEFIELDIELVEKFKQKKPTKDNLSKSIESFIKSTEESIVKSNIPKPPKKIIVEM